MEVSSFVCDSNFGTKIDLLLCDSFEQMREMMVSYFLINIAGFEYIQTYIMTKNRDF